MFFGVYLPPQAQHPIDLGSLWRSRSGKVQEFLRRSYGAGPWSSCAPPVGRSLRFRVALLEFRVLRFNVYSFQGVKVEAFSRRV